MFRELKALTIDLIVKIIFNYLKRTVHNLFTITTNQEYLLQIYKEVFCERSLLKLLNKILEKYLRNSSFLVKLKVLKMHSFTRIFQGFCLKFKKLYPWLLRGLLPKTKTASLFEYINRYIKNSQPSALFGAIVC